MSKAPIPKDENQFRYLADEPPATFPEGYSAPLDARSTLEMMADRDSQPDLRSDERKEIDAAIAKARADERERCAKIADGWLAAWSGKKPEHVSAQKWACDAVKDIADAIRAGAR